MKPADVVGRRIRQFRNEYDNGNGISGAALAKALRVKPAVISNWESSSCRPEVEELEALAVFFGRSFLDFYRDDKAYKRDQALKALLGAAGELNQDALEDVRRYAESKRRNGSTVPAQEKHR